jgi:hypothetical protein
MTTPPTKIDHSKSFTKPEHEVARFFARHQDVRKLDWDGDDLKLFFVDCQDARAADEFHYGSPLRSDIDELEQLLTERGVRSKTFFR